MAKFVRVSRSFTVRIDFGGRTNLAAPLSHVLERQYGFQIEFV